ncbi:C39 family peptidase [Heliophilum fasciatum]|uniref:Peptidase C39-like protein n=1 Tax=Heliophilum fasciatum TaxID=35700 RepID=A0A4R2RW03_9FIRM|nr:C39 family peptidase [Heliophilum fasciatum]MCW2276930.1 hypothetical protein [Heliophilum fasciatum]TCP68610.1 peptidase C39-like protein [Heliophilum fasciatum]
MRSDLGLRMKKVRRIFLTFTALMGLVSGTMVYLLTPFPSEDSATTENPPRFTVFREADFEVQGHNQCSAFATAYLLRTLGREAKGTLVYNSIDYKIPVSGYVLPKGIITYLESQGLQPSIYRGTIDTLKARLTQGNPVIVLVVNGLLWQHYMTMLGYDNAKKEVYFFDSKKEKDENDQLPGNRTLSEEYFLLMWDNGLPLFHHVYITINTKQ